MNIETLKKALTKSIPTGILSWLIYGLFFEMLIDKEPLHEALFDDSRLSFLALMILITTIIFYASQNKESKN